MHYANKVLGLLGFISGLAAVASGCEGSYYGGGGDSGTSGKGGGAGSGGSGDGGTLGVGATCSPTASTPSEECRSGLSCSSQKKCEASHAVGNGGSCVLDDSCQTGFACVAASPLTGPMCTPLMPTNTDAGPVSCSSDVSCPYGSRCDIVGFGAECAPEGTGDVGATCTSATNCLGGLSCLSGQCGQPEPGFPPALGALWAGTPCTDIKGPTTAYFSVPGGTDDADFYRLPFPNDIRLKNGKPNIVGHPTPGSSLLGYDPVQRYIDAINAVSDGWGAYGTVLFRFSGELDASTLTSTSTQVADLTANQQLGWENFYSSSRGNYICPNWVGVRAPQGAPYTPGHTYAVYMTTAVKATGGTAIVVASDFAAVMSSTQPTGNASLAAAWTAYAPFRKYLASQKPAISTSTILNAAVFTVGNPLKTLPALAAGVASAAVPTATQWTKCDVGTVSPCPQHDGSRGCPATPDPDFDELHALVSLPIFQSGPEPYLDPPDGNITVTNGVAVQVRTEQVCMSLSVPHGTPPVLPIPDGGAEGGSDGGGEGGSDGGKAEAGAEAGTRTGGFPVIVFAHGTDGSFRDQVTSGIAHDFAVGIKDGSTIVKAALLGIDQVETGPRRGMSTESPNDLFFNFGNPNAALGNPQQGGADQLSLLRFVPTVSFTAADSPTGSAFSLRGDLVAFWGHSQGATEGGLALPYSGYAGAVFSGQGASLTDALLTKMSPVNVAAAVPIALQDVTSTGTLPGNVYHPVLSLLQMYIDPADPVNFAALMAASPPMGVSPHHVFQPYGQNDTYAPPVTEATYALAAQLGLVANDAVASPDSIGGIMSMPPPVSGNVMVGNSTVTAAVREYTPSSSYDGHFVSFDNATARADVERFLAQVLEGKVPQVGQ